jgi:dolichyl-phosphate beta-glucosyltransferase
MSVMMGGRVPLSIIIPAYNEEDRLPATLDVVLDWSDKTSFFEIELIIVDDGSRDSTREIVRHYMAGDTRVRLVEEAHVGFMNAIISGFIHARYQYVGAMEADCAVHPMEFEKLFQYMNNDTIVMGSRILRGNLPPIEGKSLFRRVLSWGMSRLFFKLFKCGVYDPQLIFKLYKKNVLSKVLPMLSLEHDGLKGAEILVKAYGLGVSIKEIPVEYHHDENSRCLPKGKGFIVAIGALNGLWCLWFQSCREFQKGTFIRSPVRGERLLRLLSPIKRI